MAAFRNAHQLATSLRDLQTALPKATQTGVTKAAAIMQESVVVASGRYAGKRIVATRAFPIAPASTIVKMVSRKAHLLDHNTKRHPIVPKRKPLLVFPDRKAGHGLVFSLGVSHPGTTGKLIWEKARAVADPKMIAAIDESVGVAMYKALT